MGQQQNSPFQEGSRQMAEYRVDHREPHLLETYLTHTHTLQQFLLKELTFHELREFSIATDKLRARKGLSSRHLTLLRRSPLPI